MQEGLQMPGWFPVPPFGRGGDSNSEVWECGLSRSQGNPQRELRADLSVVAARQSRAVGVLRVVPDT